MLIILLKWSNKYFIYSTNTWKSVVLWIPHGISTACGPVCYTTFPTNTYMLWTAGVLQSLFFSSPKPPSLLHNCSGIPLELVLTKQFKTKPIKQIHSGWSHTNEFQTMISRREERQLTHQNKIEPRGHIFWTAHWRLCVLMVLCTLQNNETKKIWGIKQA